MVLLSSLVCLIGLLYIFMSKTTMAKVDRSKYKPTPIAAMALSFMSGDAFYKEKFFEDYINSVEDFLSSEKTKLEENFDAAVAATPDEAEGIYDWFEDDIIKHRDFFPSLLYHSVFVALMSYLEASLQAMVKYVGVVPKHIKGQKTLEKYRLALAPYYDVSALKKEWEFVVNCYEIRNKIVHGNAQLMSKYDLEVVPILRKYKSSITYDKVGKRFQVTNKKLLLDLNKNITRLVRSSSHAMVAVIYKLRKEKIT